MTKLSPVAGAGGKGPRDDLADLADETPASDASAQGATVALVMATQRLSDQAPAADTTGCTVATPAEAVYTLCAMI